WQFTAHGLHATCDLCDQPLNRLLVATVGLAREDVAQDWRADAVGMPPDVSPLRGEGASFRCEIERRGPDRGLALPLHASRYRHGHVEGKGALQLAALPEEHGQPTPEDNPFDEPLRRRGDGRQAGDSPATRERGRAE